MKNKSVLSAIILAALLVLGCEPTQSHEEQTIYVGGLFPLSGSAADMGPPTRDGFVLFWNENPTLLGRPVQTLIEDNKSNPTEGLTAFEALRREAEDGDLLAVMTQLSGVAAVLAPAAKREGFLQFGLAASPTLLAHEWNYRSYASANRIGEMMAAAPEVVPEVRSFFVLAMTDEYGRAVAAAFRDAAQARGLSIVGQEVFAAEVQEVNTIVQKAMNSGADAVAVTGFGRAPILCIRRLRELGFDGAIFADPATAYRPFTALVGEAAEGMYAVDLAFGPSLGGRDAESFRKAYRQAFDREADIAGAMAYAGMQVLAEAVRRADSTEPQEVAQVLDRGFEMETVLGPTTLVERDIQFPLVLKVVEGGVAKPVR